VAASRIKLTVLRCPILGARWERTQVTTGLICCRVVPFLDQGGPPPGRSRRRHGALAFAPAAAAPAPVGWRERRDAIGAAVDHSS
jgi:hypothetical protein